MQLKNVGNEKDGTKQQDIAEVLNLPHVEKLKQKLSEQVRKSTMKH